MKLSIFDAGPGDGFVIEGAGGGRILVDGGKSNDWRDHIRPVIPGFGDIDVVCVSHIDSDHIGGIEQLLRDTWDWVLHAAHADPSLKEPTIPRPPSVHGLWHNAFHDIVGDNAGPIGDLLAAMAPSLAGTLNDENLETAHQMMNIATSVEEALTVSRLRTLPEMNIPLNVPAAGKLMTVESVPDVIEIGSLRLRLLSPTEGELDELRTGWNEWLEHPDKVDVPGEIREEFRKMIDEFSSLSLNAVELAAAHRWKKFDDVTVPNLASLTFHVTDVDDHDRTALLTGDHLDDRLLDRLEERQLMTDNDGIHVDVLKVPHHGSLNNTNQEFCRRVTADHYVFCGNGGHHNPKTEVLDMYVDARAGNAVTTPGLDRNRPYTFWFSVDSPSVTGSVSREHFEKVEEHVDQLIGLGHPLRKRFPVGVPFNELDLAAVGQ